MKIEGVVGYIFAGHMGVQLRGASIIEGPDKLHNIMHRRNPGIMDRLVKTEDFVQATGCSISHCGDIVKPKNDKIKTTKKEVLNLL